jgi:hypothetical protein
LFTYLLVYSQFTCLLALLVSSLLPFPTCLLVYLFTCLLVYLFTCLFVYLLICLFCFLVSLLLLVYLFTCLLVYLSLKRLKVGPECLSVTSHRGIALAPVNVLHGFYVLISVYVPPLFLFAPSLLFSTLFSPPSIVPSLPLTAPPTVPPPLHPTPHPTLSILSPLPPSLPPLPHSLPSLSSLVVGFQEKR